MNSAVVALLAHVCSVSLQRSRRGSPSSSSSSSSSSDSSSSDEDEREMKRSKSKSRRRKDKKHRRTKQSSGRDDGEERDGTGPVRLSRFFENAKK